MGKKQKMKKAAAKAAAAAATATATAAAVAVVDEANNSSNLDNKPNNSNSSSKKKQNNGKNKVNFETKDDNMQKLLNLAGKLQTLPGERARKSLGSSGSGSSATASSDSENEDDVDITIVEDDDDDDNDDDDDAVTLVQQNPGSPASGKQLASEFSTVPKYSRGEKKARRLLMKLDLERIPNVSRVTMRKAKNVLLCIDQPDVYKCPHSKTLLCFGEVRVEDTSNAAAAQAAERYLNDVNVRPTAQDKIGELPSDEVKDDNDDEDAEAGNLDDGKLDEKDIELVIMQSACTRQKAIKALLKHNSDVVNAIMELTVG
ncbi:hypothetical protein KR222_005150 [Zaprionus bogoriensis]|nr:hypothetical protein KR222_005150 [Zaprionus bogoriensis]